MLRKSLVFLMTYLFTINIQANPAGGNVVSGSVSLSNPDANTLQVKQTSDKAIINWQSFNIGAQETTRFVQPSSSSITLNRINPTVGPAQIFGKLTANGRLILIDQAGIYFGPTAFVNVGGIIASTSDISNQNFLNGNYKFDHASTKQGSIINDGRIIAKEYGLVALVGTSVSNNGLIEANLGNVVLASGNKFTVSLDHDQLINFAVDEAANSPGVDRSGNRLKNGVNNSGTILANGGKIIISANVAKGIVDNAINMSGVAEAHSVYQRNGVIILAGGDEGRVLVSGKLNASGTTAHTQGGKIKVLGKNIKINSTAVLNAQGDNNGGVILIGAKQHTKTVAVDQGATFLADAITQGNGGTLVVWSDDNTAFHGTVSARGGILAGNGGFLETSGGYLDTKGSVIDLRAPHGSTGNWLLDPYNVSISNAASGSGSFSSDTWTPNGTSSNVNVGDLETNLASANILITTSGAGAESGNITVVDPITWSSSNTLTLQADNKIFLNANITALNGGLTLTANNVAQSITSGTESAPLATGVSANINVANFKINQGQWYQINGSLPTFSVSNDFQIAPSGSGEFLRAAGGSGSVANPYQLTDIFGVQGMGSSVAALGNHYVLNNNIDASVTTAWNGGQGFVPIGDLSNSFTGTFNGQNNIINNLYMNYTAPINSDIGLFGNTNGTIQNIGLTNVQIYTNLFGKNVGGLAGNNSANINNAFTTGTITVAGEAARAGGLVGANYGSISNSYSSANATANLVNATGFYVTLGGFAGTNFSTINNSYSTGNVLSNTTDAGGLNQHYVGGFAGENQSTITNSYTTGSVTVTHSAGAFERIGGFVGAPIFSTISDSYSVGSVSAAGGVVGGFAGGPPFGEPNTYINDYWNTQTSGQFIGTGFGNAPGLTGANTSQMKTQSTYTGWDFTNTWKMVLGDGYSYPNLAAFNQYGILGNLGSGITVNVISNGGTAASTTTDGSGNYFFILNPTVNNALLTATGGGFVSNFFYQSNGSTITPVLNANQLTIGGTASNTLLANVGSAPQSDLLYSTSGSHLQLGNASNPNVSFVTLPGVSYNVNGTIDTVTGGTSNITFNGPTTISGGTGITTTGNQTYNNSLTIAANNIQLSTGSGNITLHGINSSGFNLILNGTSGNNRFNLSGLNNLGGGTLTINAVINTPITAPFQNNTIDFSGYGKTVDILLNSNINSGTLTIRENGSQLATFNGIATAIGNLNSQLTVAKTNPDIIYNAATRSGQIVDPFYFFDIFPTQLTTPTTTEAIFLPNSVIYQPTSLSTLEMEETSQTTIWTEINQLETDLITQQMKLDQLYEKILTVCF